MRRYELRRMRTASEFEHRLALLTLVIAGCREPTASAASSRQGAVPNAIANLQVGDRFRYRVDLTVRGDGTPYRYQVDAIVDVVVADGDKVETREQFERTFGETESSFGWFDFDGLATSNVFDRTGNLVTRSVTSPRVNAGSTLDRYLPRPILDLGYSAPGGAAAGSTWTRTYDMLDNSAWTGWIRDEFTLGGVAPCGRKGSRCRTVTTTDHLQIEWVPRTHAVADGQRDMTIDASDGRLLRSSGSWSRSVVDDSSGAPVSTSMSIELIDRPSPRPVGMSDHVGTLQIVVRPWAEIWVDGARDPVFRETPYRRSLPVGRHTVRIANTEHDETIDIRIVPARVTTIERDWCASNDEGGSRCWKW